MYKEKREHHSNEYDLYQDLEKIKSALAGASRDLKGKAGQLYSQSLDDLKEKSTHIQENISDYISEKPLKSLGIALVAGIVIGYFIHNNK